MLYLGTSPYQPEIKELLDLHRLGLMCQPASHNPRSGWIWAADNGCFAETWREDRWLAWLRRDHPRAGCLFAVVPDVVADHEATLDRWKRYAAVVAEERYPLAFVGQNGATVDNVPWEEFDCLFIGGDTAWKMGPAFGLAEAARERGKWIHVGRINGGGRFAAWTPFADSCDGTFLAFGPQKNLPRLTRWLENADREPSLWVT